MTTRETLPQSYSLFDPSANTATELAERTGQRPDATSKHMAILRNAGIVTAGRNCFYQIQPQFVADKENRILDFGWCVMRLNLIA